jgi:dihydropteroate synthase
LDTSEIRVKNTKNSRQFLINCQGKLLTLQSPVVMGIINNTPDSFYDGGKYKSDKEILTHIERMLTEGAAIIDIGAVSTRPGATPIDEKEEIAKLLPLISASVKEFPEIILSVDTFRSGVAKALVEAGAHIINDVSGGNMDDKMFETVAALKAPYLIMHMQGTPATMQKNPQYKNVMDDLQMFFLDKISALKSCGVNDIIIDPGFGFGKTVEHNYEILNNLEYFKAFGLPLMVGISRKSMINKVLDTKPEGALNGTTVANTIALLKGADILRVHDVKEAVEAVKIINALR